MRGAVTSLDGSGCPRRRPRVFNRRIIACSGSAEDFRRSVRCAANFRRERVHVRRQGTSLARADGKLIVCCGEHPGMCVLPCFTFIPTATMRVEAGGQEERDRVIHPFRPKIVIAAGRTLICTLIKSLITPPDFFLFLDKLHSAYTVFLVCGL